MLGWSWGLRSLFVCLLDSCVCRVKEQHRWRGAVVPQGGGGSELSADRKVFGPRQGSWGWLWWLSGSLLSIRGACSPVDGRASSRSHVTRRATRLATRTLRVAKQRTRIALPPQPSGLSEKARRWRAADTWVSWLSVVGTSPRDAA